MTRFSVVESVRHLIGQYRSFIMSSYRLADITATWTDSRTTRGSEILCSLWDGRF